MMQLLAIRSIALATLVFAGQPVWADDDCDAPPETWQPRSVVRALAERNGWQIDKLKIDDGCYEIKGRDVDDRRFKARLDPATLKVVRMKKHERDDRERTRDRPAATPPGAKPRTEMD